MSTGEENVFRELKKKMESHYRESLQLYFADQTDEGSLFKYAKAEEDGYILRHFFDQPEENISKIYEEEYWTEE